MKYSLQDPSQTHFPSPIVEPAMQLPKEEKISLIAEHFRQIMVALGLDLQDPSLEKTPLRVARMYVNEVFTGLDSDTFPNISYIPYIYKDGERSQMILVNVSFTSFCEHHFVPIHGVATVAYLPNEKLIGLSKIPRIVNYFARRPQVQERLTAQIADSLSLLLDTEDVAISLQAKHYCVIARGVEDINSQTITNVLRGRFISDPARHAEFFEGLNRHLNS